MIVKKITKSVAEAIVSNKHYSRRIGIFWEGFGLYQNDTLIGVVCYGQPSAPIQKYAFKDRDFRLYELSRLVIDHGVENGASILISRSLKMLSEQPSAVVSYADSMHGHCGIVYQATNWMYTGAVISHNSMYYVDGELLHNTTIKDRYGITDAARWAKENNYPELKPQKKHRYFYLNGSKNEKRKMLAKLSYPTLSEYPKADKQMYDSGLSCVSYIETDLMDFM